MQEKKYTSGQDREDSVQQHENDKVNCEAPDGRIVGFTFHGWSPLLKDNYTLHKEPDYVEYH
jgi:hypothetical protein